MSAADFSAFVIAMREGIEAVLVVGILLAYLAQVNARAAQRWVWLGVASAILVSLGALGILNALDAELAGRSEQLFEGTTMVLAAIFLTWMIFWMLRNARHLKSELQRSVQGVLDRGGMARGIFLLAFFAVVREGVELALLLFATPGEGKLLGSVTGLAVAVGVGVLIYAFGRRIDLRTFFKVTTIILVLFAAGLIATAAHAFAEAGLLAAVEGPTLWSMRSVLPEADGLGAILATFVGYQDEPTVIDVVAYLGYFVVVWVLSRTQVATAPITAKASRAA